MSKIRTQKELAEDYGVSISTLKNYARAGVDIRSPGAVAEERERRGSHRLTKQDRERAPAGGMSYEEGRRRKLVAEAELAEHKLADLRASYTSNEELHRDLAHIGQRIGLGLDSLAEGLAPECVGLDEAAIQKKVRVAVDTTLRAWSDPASPLFVG